MFGIRKTFRRLFGRGAADAFNSVVAYLNNFCSDESIDFHRPDSPSAENPPCIGINKTWLSAVLAEIGTDLSSVGANKIVGTNGSSQPAAAADIPTSANNTWDRMLVCGAGGTTLSFKNVRAESPSSTTTLVAGNSTASSAQGSAHTATDGNGFVIPVVTRVVFTGTKLYSFYANLTFDKYGRLYSVSGETRLTVDTPTKVVWS